MILRAIKNTAAETLAEILISLIVLSVGIGGSMTLVVMSISANTMVQERVQAYQFAREGVEAVRNIRDTNWMRFASDHTNCWDVKPVVTDTSQCSTVTYKLVGSVGGSRNYIIYPELAQTDRLFSWRLTTASGNDTTIYATTINGQTLYTHDPTGADGLTDATPYSRIITIEKTASDVLEVTSVVSWESKGESYSVSFSDELTNY